MGYSTNDVSLFSYLVQKRGMTREEAIEYINKIKSKWGDFGSFGKETLK